MKPSDRIKEIVREIKELDPHEEDSILQINAIIVYLDEQYEIKHGT